MMGDALLDLDSVFESRYARCWQHSLRPFARKAMAKTRTGEVVSAIASIVHFGPVI